MALVDPKYSSASLTLLPSQSVAAGTSAQSGRSDCKPDAVIEWFSSGQATESHPITIRASAVSTGEVTLGALAGDILSCIAEYAPD